MPRRAGLSAQMVHHVEGIVAAGHKEDAVPVAFDPGERFGVRAVRFAPRRTGYAVDARIGRHTFCTHIVARSGRFWLLLPPDVQQAAGIAAGDRVDMVVSPVGGDRQRR